MRQLKAKGYGSDSTQTRKETKNQVGIKSHRI